MNTLRLLGPPFFYTHLMAMMEKVKYSKPVLKIQLLIDKIKEKGFEMSDHEAENIVGPFVVNNGYYHISSYMKCFCKSENSIDTVEGKNINFRNVITLYRLSKDLEEVLFSMLLRIEVFLKSNFIHHTTQFYNDAFWHIKPQNIISIDSWEHRKECIRKIQKENKNAPIVKSFFDILFDEGVDKGVYDLIDWEFKDYSKQIEDADVRLNKLLEEAEKLQ